MNIKISYKLTILFLVVVGLFLRLWHIEFGLPHSFHADEPEIAELAIKYTYEIRDVVKNNNWYKLIPISFVYGTVPTYFNTFLTMAFSKSLGILNIPFKKHHIYIFLRSVNAVLSFVIVPVIAYLYYKLFKNKTGALITFALLALNWKLIVHAHYINVDIFQTIFLALSFLTLYLYYERGPDNKYTVLTGILFGLAVGTKITTLIGLPLYFYVFLAKKDPRGLFGFFFVIVATFMATNPFSMIFATDFAFRIYTMFTKEAGMVFDSVDSGLFKYLFALSFTVTLPVLLLSLYGKLKTKCNPFHKFLIGYVVVYLIFFSLQSRRVDRWLLPIIPIIILYASHALVELKKYWWVIVFGLYCYYPFLLLQQFKKHTPKSEAYLWMRDNVAPSLNKLSYTEEGLDPMNKLPGMRVVRMEVYSEQNAHYFMPENADGYDYVVTASKPMSNHKRSEVREAYPFYYERWNAWENNLHDPTKWELVKDFTLPKPNLVNLSDIHIYKNLSL
ncbi:ArnT family glycosyltransferase [Patescibacteria group bacterium]